MKDIAHVRATFLDSPLLMHAPNHLADALNSDPQTAWSTMISGEEPETETHGSILILPLHGTLVDRGGYWGLVSYEWLTNELRKAEANPNVIAVIQDVNTNGGVASGCADYAQAVDDFSKPIYSVVNSRANSAGYWAVANSDKIFATRDAVTGSIGAIYVHVNTEKANKKAGYDFEVIKSGELKDEGASYKSLSDAGRAFLRKQVNDIADEFIESVASARGLSVEKVRGLEAGVFTADQSLELGLVDHVTTADAAISMILQEVQNMDPKDENKGKGAGARKPDGQEPKSTPPSTDPAANKDNPVDLKQLRQEARQEAADAIAEARQVSAEINEICQSMDRVDLAAELIRSCKSADEARVKLFNMAMEKQPEIFNNIGDPGEDESNEETSRLEAAQERLNARMGA